MGTFPTSTLLDHVVAAMAEQDLAAAPPPKGMTRLWGIREAESADSKPIPDYLRHMMAERGILDAMDRWFVRYPSMLGFYAQDRWPHSELIAVDVPDEMVDAFRVSGFPRHSRDTRTDNPKAFSLDPENEFFLPRSTATSARKVGHVRDFVEPRTEPPRPRTQRAAARIEPKT
jgi:hypothetical protein